MIRDAIGFGRGDGVLFSSHIKTVTVLAEEETQSPREQD